MKLLSELIKELEDLKKESGDIEVFKNGVWDIVNPKPRVEYLRINNKKQKKIVFWLEHIDTEEQKGRKVIGI